MKKTKKFPNVKSINKKTYLSKTILLSIIIFLIVFFLELLLNRTQLFRNNQIKYAQNKEEVQIKIQRFIDDYEKIKKEDNNVKLIEYLKSIKEEENIDEIISTTDNSIEIELNNFYAVIDVKLLTINLIETDVETHFFYEFEGIKDNKAKVLIRVKNKNVSIDKIKLPDGDILCVDNKNEIGIDYEIENEVDYNFKIITKDGTEKNELINLKIPNKPKVADITIGFPTLYITGFEQEKLDIEYDSREGFINYYSFDEGKTWTIYKEPINIKSTQIYVRTVNLECIGFNVEEKKQLQKVSDSVLSPECYDKDEETYTLYDIAAKYRCEFCVDESMWNRKMEVTFKNKHTGYGTRNLYLYCYDKDNNLIETIDLGTVSLIPRSEPLIVYSQIPENTKKASLFLDIGLYVHEINVVPNKMAEEKK